jgi:hypothetical protein
MDLGKEERKMQKDRKIKVLYTANTQLIFTHWQ